MTSYMIEAGNGERQKLSRFLNCVTLNNNQISLSLNFLACYYMGRIRGNK